MRGLDKTMDEQINESGMTPLHLAALQGDLTRVESLLDAGANPDKINNNNQNPLFSALMLPIRSNEALKENKICVYRLLKTRMPKLVNQVDANGETVAHLMASFGFDTLIKDLVQEENPILFISNNYSKYPIHAAILNGHHKVVKELLNIKGMSEVVDAEERTPLHYAARYGDKSMVTLCCDKSTQLDSRDSSDKTPLMLAEEAGNQDAIKVLRSKIS